MYTYVNKLLRNNNNFITGYDIGILRIFNT